MKYYVIAGEPSGDLHGSNMLKELKRKDPNIQLRYWGGDKMQEVVGCPPVKHIKHLAFMGFVAVIRNLRTILNNIKKCKRDIDAFEPDVVVLIDYPGFNLRIAEYAKKKGYKVAYYIAPQVWAWKPKRIEKLKSFVDELMVILPFEKEYFESRGKKAHFVGHPLKNAIEGYEVGKIEFPSKDPVIALLPGSRRQELERMLPVMNHLKIQGYQFVVAGTKPHQSKTYLELGMTNFPVVFDATYDILAHASYAVVTSGTATLEAAMWKVPQVVVYKGSRLMYEVGRRLVNVDFISLVNLIAGKEVVKELIQDECTVAAIEKELRRLISSDSAIEDAYSSVAQKLGTENASVESAKIIFDLAKG